MTDAAARVIAQCKVNLRLRLLARERSGYHQIETIFQRLALGDEVVVRVGGRDRTIDCRGDDVGPAEQNLAWRAALLYAESGWPAYFSIEIDKRVPVGAGLGGGSADAGAVLRALDALNPSPLGTEHLLDIAGRLGADVPVLTTTGATTLAWGRGQRMLALAPLPERSVWLLVPPFRIATTEAYAWMDEARERQPRALGEGEQAALLVPEVLADWDGIAAFARNDFEGEIGRRQPSVPMLIESLHALGARPAMLSGSGSAVFGVFAPERAPAAWPGSTTGARAIATRTASRVVPVERLE
ncbi:MAG TPA: 4-(cytidine 5'-diphospho)-2-C-methyl-D-erythritol kinase [Gemmatimonadaceae bacterium]|nr:4-(cytidine 5'-diphospho)-2-C-methyl-D-erythritol kinase [Gemmatimonadaceae bacterium]